METTDARGLKHDELTALRKRGVKAVQRGESPEDVARVLGISRGTIYNWLALYRNGGWDALDAQKRGGRKRKLDGKAMSWLYKAIADKTPEQYQFPFVLWTSKLVARLIKERLGISLSKASVCRLMNQLGLSAQKPLWRAYQQNPQHVEQWLEEEFPSLRTRAKKVFLIVDGHPTHKARKVSQFVETVSDRLELFFLPPYSPELNPDELVLERPQKQLPGPQGNCLC